MWLVKISLCISILGSYGLVLAYKYKAIPDDDLFQPCPNEESSYLTNFVDMKNLNIIRVDDENFKIDGNYTWKATCDPNSKVQLSAKIERKSRGVWSAMPQRFEVNDFCSRLFVPSEIWYKFVKNWKGEMRKCPPPVGVTHAYNNQELSVVVDDFPARKMSGEYRSIVRFICADLKICFILKGELIEM